MARLGGTFAVFGTDGETYGIVRSVEKNKTVEENPLPRGDGEVYAVEQFKEIFAYSGELVLIASGGPDFTDVGSGATFACPELDDAIYMKSLTLTETAEDWATYAFEGTSWPYLGTLVTTTTTTTTTS
jgi:hypothetical protein